MERGTDLQQVFSVVRSFADRHFPHSVTVTVTIETADGREARLPVPLVPEIAPKPGTVMEEKGEEKTAVKKTQGRLPGRTAPTRSRTGINSG